MRDPLLPPPLAPTAGLVGRERLFVQLKARLLAGGTLVLSALQGLPGVGKTALALALAHDPEVGAHFADGALWAGLGQTQQVQETLARWGTLLGLAEAGGTRISTPAAWAQALRTVIGSRRFLFVPDDAWSLELVLACQVGGAGCAALVTTFRIWPSRWPVGRWPWCPNWDWRTTEEEDALLRALRDTQASGMLPEEMVVIASTGPMFNRFAGMREASGLPNSRIDGKSPRGVGIQQQTLLGQACPSHQATGRNG